MRASDKPDAPGLAADAGSAVPVSQVSIESHPEPLGQQLHQRVSKSGSSEPKSIPDQVTDTQDSSKRRRSSPKKKTKDLSNHFIVENQTLLSFIVMASVWVLHLFPFAQPYTSRFLFIQNVDKQTGLARIGSNDTYLMVYWIVVLTFIRSFFVDYILRALALKAKFTTRKSINRFIEQSWAMVYYSAAFGIGIYLLHESDYWLSADKLWAGWPHFQLPVQIKAYYLIQLAGWFQQIYVLHVEDRRKDHYQMFTHHIVTCMLIIGSYNYHYTRVGHVIMILMDGVDIQLALAKLLNYMGWSLLCDITFGVFTITWIICRHILYNYVVWSAWKALDTIPQRCYYDDDGELVKCFTPMVHGTLVVLLCVLQVITVIWLFMIIRIITRVLMGTASANDDRSDDESEEDNEDEKDK